MAFGNLNFSKMVSVILPESLKIDLNISAGLMVTDPIKRSENKKNQQENYQSNKNQF